ncbi:DUF664 domain-containing protein, partial [Streptomyces sp. NPDC005568]|uniref:mycothiol transferase n=1 Tax=Streptomyces sp. NPDC005568 TaxID=3156887 RepID=UPI0033B1EA55
MRHVLQRLERGRRRRRDQQTRQGQSAVHGERVSMRWVMLRLISETARHAGHADIVRES